MTCCPSCRAGSTCSPLLCTSGRGQRRARARRRPVRDGCKGAAWSGTMRCAPSKALACGLWPHEGGRAMTWAHRGSIRGRFAPRSHDVRCRCSGVLSTKARQMARARGFDGLGRSLPFFHLWRSPKSSAISARRERAGAEHFFWIQPVNVLRRRWVQRHRRAQDNTRTSQTNLKTPKPQNPNRFIKILNSQFNAIIYQISNLIVLDL